MHVLLAQLSDESREGLLNNVEKAREIQENFSSVNPAFAIACGFAVLVFLTLGWLTIGSISRILGKRQSKPATDNLNFNDNLNIPDKKALKTQPNTPPKIELRPKKKMDTISKKVKSPSSNLK